MHHDDRDNQSIQHTFARSIVDEPNKSFTDRIVESFAGPSGSDTDRFAESFAGPSASGSSFTEKTGEENSTDHDSTSTEILDLDEFPASYNDITEETSSILNFYLDISNCFNNCIFFKETLRLLLLHRHNMMRCKDHQVWLGDVIGNRICVHHKNFMKSAKLAVQDSTFYVRRL